MVGGLPSESGRCFLSQVEKGWVVPGSPSYDKREEILAAYSWVNACEQLKLWTRSGVAHAQSMVGVF